jgi:uridylate kinase
MLYKDGTLEVDVGYLKRFCALVRKLHAEGEKLVIVVGGGALAKKYASQARDKTHSEFFADRSAIKATRENAQIVIGELGSVAHAIVCLSPDDCALALKAGKVAVSGGFLEGITTDACSVIVAERTGAKHVLNVSAVDGVFDSDPRKNPEAKHFATMTHAKLLDIAVRDDDRKARAHFIFDLVACKLAARSNIVLHFVGGANLAEVEKALRNEPHGGTVVKG